MFASLLAAVCSLAVHNAFASEFSPKQLPSGAANQMVRLYVGDFMKNCRGDTVAVTAGGVVFKSANGTEMKRLSSGSDLLLRGKVDGTFGLYGDSGVAEVFDSTKFEVRDDQIPSMYRPPWTLEWTDVGELKWYDALGQSLWSSHTQSVPPGTPCQLNPFGASPLPPIATQHASDDAASTGVLGATVDWSLIGPAIGGIGGALVISLLVIVVIVLVRRRRRRRRLEQMVDIDISNRSYYSSSSSFHNHTPIAQTTALGGTAAPTTTQSIVAAGSLRGMPSNGSAGLTLQFGGWTPVATVAHMDGMPNHYNTATVRTGVTPSRYQELSTAERGEH